MTIRKANASDVSNLHALEREIFTPENFPLSRASLSYHVKNNLIYVAEIEGEIAGYILALVKRRHAKLYSLGVNSLYRGQNVASKLLETIIFELLHMGFKHIFLEVRTDNETAIALYKKFGFNVKKTLEAFYLDKRDAYLMEFKAKE